MFLRGSLLSLALIGSVAAVASAQQPESESGACFGEYTVTKVVPHKAAVMSGQGTYDQLVGARAYVPAKPGLTGEWLHAELARRARSPRGNTDCPLDVAGVEIDVRSAGPGFWVSLTSEERKRAKEVLRRAKTLTR